MSNESGLKNLLSSRFAPLSVVLMSAIYTLWLRYFLYTDNSFLSVSLAEITLIALLIINTVILKSTPASAPRFFKNKHTAGKLELLIITVVVAVFIANSLRYYDIMPVILAGESNLVLERADLLISYWHISPLHFLINVTNPATYNWGLSVIYAPLKSIIGDAQSTVKIFMIVVWAGILALTLWTFTTWHKMRGAAILLLTPAIVNAATLLSVRTYKWHIMAALSSSAIYFLIQQLQANENAHVKKGAILLGGLLLAFCVLTYHATIVYIPLMLAIMGINAFYRDKTINRKMAIIIGMFIVGGIIFLMKTNAAALLIKRFNDVVINNMEETTLTGNIYSFFSLCLIHGTAWPLTIMFLLGLSAGFARWKTDIAARTILMAFFILFAVLLFSYGVTNLDENSYIVIFIVGIILLGIKEFYTIIFPFLKNSQRVLVAIVLTVLMTLLEAQQIYTFDTSNTIFINSGKAFPFENNQAMYLVMDIKKRENVVIYFPDKTLMAAEGGFDNDEIYDFPETALILKKAHPFAAIDTLKNEIITQLKNEPQKPVLVYYNSWNLDLEKKLEGMGNTIIVEKIMAPYPNVWISGEHLSYLAIYNADQKPTNIQPSPYFYKTVDGDETTMVRVRRLARIIRGSDGANYF